uniref:PUM-HD domain-containing protein n=1 Tax=Romanomermis culicivorax TaxID=13658 RepID=A0A915HNI9_ROMCU
MASMNGNTILEQRGSFNGSCSLESGGPATCLGDMSAFGVPPSSVYSNGFSKFASMNGSQSMTNGNSAHFNGDRDDLIVSQLFNGTVSVTSAASPVTASTPFAMNGCGGTATQTTNNLVFPTSTNESQSAAAYNQQQQWSYIFDFMNKRWFDGAQNGSSLNGNVNRNPFYSALNCSMPSRPDFDQNNFNPLTNISNNGCYHSGSNSPYFQQFGLSNGHSRCSSIFDYSNSECGRPSPVFATPSGCGADNRPSSTLQQQPLINGATTQCAQQSYIQNCDRNGSSSISRRLSPSMLDSFLNDNRLLEEFRAGRLPNLQLRDLVNHVIDFAQDQYGSRFIQQRLQYATDIEKQMVFNEILPSAHLLTINVFGNYVIQKFFELGTSSQKMQMLDQMRGKILNLTLNMYGCRVVQKALERVEREGQRMIADELTGHILRCVKDQNGNHVVQKVIETLDAKQLAFVVLALAGQYFYSQKYDSYDTPALKFWGISDPCPKEVALSPRPLQNIVALSTHSYGCRVIQRILERCSEEEKLSILNELIENFPILVVDQYGNYVVQHILQHGNQETRSRIIQAVRGDMIRLSQHKFASNVVEKCVEFATTEERRVLINDIIGKANAGTVASCPLLLMMKDQYANYVVQKMLELSEPVQRKEMMYLIRYHMPTLKRYTYGKHILEKVENM